MLITCFKFKILKRPKWSPGFDNLIDYNKLIISNIKNNGINLILLNIKSDILCVSWTEKSDNTCGYTVL